MIMKIKCQAIFVVGYVFYLPSQRCTGGCYHQKYITLCSVTIQPKEFAETINLDSKLWILHATEKVWPSDYRSWRVNIEDRTVALKRHVGYPYLTVHCWVDYSHDWHAGWCVICQIWDYLCVSCNVFYELHSMRSSFHSSYIDRVFYDCGSACGFPASTQLRPYNHTSDTEIPSVDAGEDQDSLSRYAVADSGFSNLPV